MLVESNWVMQLPPPQAIEYVEIVSEVGPVKVVFAGVVKFGLNFQTARSLLDTPSAMIGLGAPAGGGVALSASPASRPPYDDEVL